MIIVTVRLDESNTAQVELPCRGLVVDPRPIGQEDKAEDFYCVTVLKFLIVVAKKYGGHCFLKFRIYNPEEEEIPPFTSNSYTYYGLEGEYAPRDTEEVTIHPSAHIIKGYAFSYCKKLKKCTMGDGVTEIGQNAFYKCTSLKSIKLSRNLQYISYSAFCHCKSIDALFIPSSVKSIGMKVFYGCKQMRILSLREDAIFNLDDLASCIVTTTDILPFEMKNQLLFSQLRFDEVTTIASHFQEWVMGHLDNSNNPLFKLCMDTDVSTRRIEDTLRENGVQCAYQANHHGLTPLHVLVMNPYATINMIQACYAANPSAAIMRDGRGMTPIDYMWEYDNVEGIISIVHSLCTDRESYFCESFDNHNKRKRDDSKYLSSSVISLDRRRRSDH